MALETQAAAQPGFVMRGKEVSHGPAAEGALATASRRPSTLGSTLDAPPSGCSVAHSGRRYGPAGRGAVPPILPFAA